MVAYKRCSRDVKVLKDAVLAEVTRGVFFIMTAIGNVA